MFENIKKDIKRYTLTEDAKSFLQIVYMFLLTESLWVLLSYRFGRWVRHDLRIPVLKHILKILTLFSHKALCLLTGIDIQFDTKIGAGFYIGHSGGIVINSSAEIGENCSIGTGVVIGQGGRGSNKGVPVIGNFVYIGVGAKVLGKIKIADNVTIGANAVVTKDMPENATVVGIPGEIINLKGSQDFIRY